MFTLFLKHSIPTTILCIWGNNATNEPRRVYCWLKTISKSPLRFWTTQIFGDGSKIFGKWGTTYI